MCRNSADLRIYNCSSFFVTRFSHLIFCTTATTDETAETPVNARASGRLPEFIKTPPKAPAPKATAVALLDDLKVLYNSPLETFDVSAFKVVFGASDLLNLKDS